MRANSVPHASTRTAPAQPDAALQQPAANHSGRPGHCHAHAPRITHLPCPEPCTLPGCAAADVLSPAERYEELFVAVQAGGLFADSKTFPDCVPLDAPEAILARYRAERHAPGFSLEDFVAAHFDRETEPASHYQSRPDDSLREHIDGLWPVLTREPAEHPPMCSLLPLPAPYVVPGGRFRELYYWDSYFTMLGLSASGRRDLLQPMVDNFAYLLDTYGHVPNGTRSYYLSRSQPPVFSLMIELLEDGGDGQRDTATALRYLPQLKREHAFWMDGSAHLKPGCAHRRVVRLPDGTLLNRYWDDRAYPREEAYLEDVETARRSHRPAHLVFRDLRAAAESGWDFSSRWCDPVPADGTATPDLSTIHTTSILPVDLNALLWHAECHLAALCDTAGAPDDAAHYREAAARRQQATGALMWDAGAGAFLDVDWCRGTRRPNLSAATLMPLFVGMATAGQADAVAATVASRLLEEGGLATTEIRSAEQWDRPNGWAPLQWVGIAGLRRYGATALADDIAHRWLCTVSNLYAREYKLVEKYRLVRRHPGSAEGGSGGEYPLQDGFGWTNGVVSALLACYPAHPASESQAGRPETAD
ncbi:alpha,alpha-trehalase TreF [Cupriavidus agavae]|uniref:Alpha,alpha-trehalase n=1 Tax=Cupriavidus agavae TaxID=1001822 RepID=A0A4Q7RRP3_9BURK|nr:alpha,alpha-trehalase TreF [Cupriavidus agavae]RZT36375.1 alpha,alpha-trehalase [Cupriavidus agavae]